MNVEPSQIEHRLHEELGTVARSVTTPPPPAVADLVRRAGREQTRGRRNVVVTSGLVAAAVVGALLLGNQLGKPDASPSPAPPAPTQIPTPYSTGAPLRTWIDEYGNFTLAGTTITGQNWGDARTSGDLTTASSGTYDGGDYGVFLGSRLVDTLHLVAVPAFPVSPDHRTLAWVAFDKNDRSRGYLVVGRAAEDGVHELGRIEAARLVPRRASGPPESIFSIADDGTVLYGGAEGPGHSWKPGGVPQAADVSAYQHGRDGFPATVAQDLQMNPTRTWGAWSTDGWTSPTDETDVRYRSVTVQRTGDPGSRRKISFPARYDYVNIAGWESDTDLIVYADPPGKGATRYLRCHVTDSSCEQAPLPSTK